MREAILSRDEAEKYGADSGLIFGSIPFQVSAQISKLFCRLYVVRNMQVHYLARVRVRFVSYRTSRLILILFNVLFFLVLSAFP
jgi:hypothetical protein